MTAPATPRVRSFSVFPAIYRLLLTTQVTRARLAALGGLGAAAVVVGYPLRLDGSAGIQCEKVDRFIAALQEVVPVPVIAWDETLSTKEAEGLMREAGVARRKRRGMVDRVAAAVILQDYLNRRSSRGGGNR